MNEVTIPESEGSSLNVSREPEQRVSPPRVTLVDHVPQAVADAEKDRQEAYDAVHEWGGKILHGFTRSREDLWHRLCASDVPLPSGFILSENLSAWIGHAAKLLYLCSHTPDEFAHLRPDTTRFLASVDEWSDENIPRGQEVQAVTLAIKIHNQSHVTQAVARPSDRKSDSGN